MIRLREGISLLPVVSVFASSSDFLLSCFIRASSAALLTKRKLERRKRRRIPRSFQFCAPKGHVIFHISFIFPWKIADKRYGGTCSFFNRGRMLVFSSWVAELQLVIRELLHFTYIVRLYLRWFCLYIIRKFLSQFTCN